MSEVFTLDLPSDAAVDLAEIEAEVRAIDGVDDAGTLDARSIDPATIGVWVQIVGSGVGIVTAAMPIVTKILDVVRRHRIPHAKLRFAGGEIDLDGVSVAELERLLAALEPPSAPAA